MSDTQTTPWRPLDLLPRERLSVGARSLSLARCGLDGGPTILFLHGVTRSWRSFYTLLPALSPSFRLVCLDFRGHGRSDPASPEAYRVVDYVADALAVLAHLAERGAQDSVVLHGHSLGAMVALAAAARAPARVRAVVLEDPPFSTMGERLPSTPLGRYFRGVRECLRSTRHGDALALYEAFSDLVVGEDARGEPVRVRDQRDETSRRFSAESLAALDPAVLEPVVEGQWLDGYDLEALAGEVRCPVTLLQADLAQGGMLTDSDVRLLTARLGARLRLRGFPGAGHSIHWTRPLEALAELRTVAST